jgi:hypothetical protein
MEPGRPRLIGLFEEEEQREDMEAAMGELFDKVPFEGLSEDDCEPSVASDQLVGGDGHHSVGAC